ncbi:polysaccharide deacetylase family protein [Pseudorhodoferax sp. Leaf267]|uniref:polysaccharide deacetylase family protein n=1 Tax=Pseudorhodoferax sp. Leaf267 TaxID=1736316 RepID=UPI0007020A88|nr:polysaccharide deacetylase family protein [Pseudorhodoferax sp. Leaf267]KQP22415.1 hypothetical protein ASF43_00325 [Pseudorhodoferax sp. Leaf267]
MLAAATLLLAACTAPRIAPPMAASGTAAPAQAPADGVLARGDKLLVYLPGAGESLRSIAAKWLGSEEHDWQIAAANGDIDKPQAGQPLVVPLKAVNPGGIAVDRYQTVPVLCYHRFGNGGGRMVISPARFAAQMEWLVQNGYRVVRLDRVADYLAGQGALPPRAVVVTVDDGYESFYQHAWPVLRRLNLPSTVFVYTDFIGSGQALGWGQLQEMAATGLVDVQAHSKTHRNLIERLPGEADDRYRQSLEQEIRGPREVLEKRLQTQVRHYAFPFGDANEQVLETLSRQRYQLAVTVTPGGNPFFAQPLMLRRTMIFGDHDLEAFKARLQTSRRFGAEP